jgi:beta propeller repeat protein
MKNKKTRGIFLYSVTDTYQNIVVMNTDRMRKFCIFLILVGVFSGFKNISIEGSTEECTILYDGYHSLHGEPVYSTFNSQLPDRFTVEYTYDLLTREKINNFDILLISDPVRTFSEEEISSITQFVEEGGGLLLMGQGWYWVNYHKEPIGEYPLNHIAREFGVTIHGDNIIDPTSQTADGLTIFTKFSSHPTTEGVTQVHSGAPSSLSITGEAVPIVMGGEDSYSTDPEVGYEPGDYPPAAAALEYGEGRAVFIGTGILTDYADHDKYDNIQFGINIFDWFCSDRKGGEFPIVTYRYDQIYPAIYGDIVVWKDERNGNEDIYGYNLETGQEFPVTTHLSDQSRPAVYNDIIVWDDERNGNSDIYGYNLSTGQEFQITEDPSGQWGPEIYGSVIVWTDERNGNQDIYGLNLETGEEFQITTDPGYQGDPAIYGDVVVWADERHGKSDIYGYNLSRKEEFPIAAHKDYYQRSPALYGNIVVWQDNRSGWCIYGYNLLTDEEFPVVVNSSQQLDPAVYGDIVIWYDNRNGNDDVFAYNLSTQEEFQITANSSEQWFVAIHENIVVWADKRSGSYDIYGYDLSTTPPPPTTLPPSAPLPVSYLSNQFPIVTNTEYQRSPALHEDIVIWEDWRGGNYDIYGYNLTTKEEFPIVADQRQKFSPALYGDIIVWMDQSNYDHNVYGYNSSTKEEFQVPPRSNEQWDPKIYKNVVVWTDYTNGNSDIYGYNILTGEGFPITTDPYYQVDPAIYENIIVWVDEGNGTNDIYSYNLVTHEKVRLTTHESHKSYPALYGDIVVWQDVRNGNWDIYGYDLKTREEFQITTDPHDQSRPALYGDVVVWVDYRSGYSDICGCILSTQEEFQITRDSSDQWGPALYGSVVVWTDERNGNDDIYGCRLPVLVAPSTSSPPSDLPTIPQGPVLVSIFSFIVTLIALLMAFFKVDIEMVRRTCSGKKAPRVDSGEELTPKDLIKTYAKESQFEYDIAISFAGENREIAKKLAEKLRAKAVKVFYDEFYKSELWGKELTAYFQDIYGPKTRFVVVLMSEYYPVKDWTGFEFSIMRREAERRKTEFILPVRLDDTKMEGIKDDVAYLDYQVEGIDSIVECLLEKIARYLEEKP